MESTGILVLGHSRPAHLAAVLESLARQEALGLVCVWLDGAQGKSIWQTKVRQCREVAACYPGLLVTIMNGHLGIEKLMLDALGYMATRYHRIIVLEDDCFPTRTAVTTFLHALDGIRDEEQFFSVYGHPFLVSGENGRFPRFQGWGWATWSHKLEPILAEAKLRYAMAEPDYRAWVEQALTPQVHERLAATPGRYPPARLIYSWDSCFALLTAMQGLCHRRTSPRVIYNCGLGPDSSHFPDAERWRRPPYNMIRLEEVWNYFDNEQL
ncbi:MAG: hypothetical protein FJW20_07275 [Acidimicrobiia bacterium]|nr:hypothetical protein [Acidimicrobiia bacterium]